MLFIDPGDVGGIFQWHPGDENRFSLVALRRQVMDGGRVIVAFRRRALLSYWYLILKLTICGTGLSFRSILYFNNDDLSKFIYSNETDLYGRFFKKVHSTPYYFEFKKMLGLSVWRSIFFTCLPAVCCAFQRFILVEDDRTVVVQPPELSTLNYMFFPNVDEKLFLADLSALQNGSGCLLKTTINPYFLPVVEKGFQSALMASQQCSHLGLVPEVIGKFAVNGRVYYQEKIVPGNTLANKLRDPGVYGNPAAVCTIIDQLSAWYQTYKSRFDGQRRSLAELYAPIFCDFNRFYADDMELCHLSETFRQQLDNISSQHYGLIPITTHNDLWPPNILVTDNGLVAIDWERATPERAWLFDYFWMHISTTLEYLSAPGSFDDFSYWFRDFLDSDDPVCRYVQGKLSEQMRQNNLHPDHKQLFLGLFLMELSIHGRLLVGETHGIDLKAAEEFRHFASGLLNRTENTP
jgi:hypothetical protein